MTATSSLQRRVPGWQPQDRAKALARLAAEELAFRAVRASELDPQAPRVEQPRPGYGCLLALVPAPDAGELVDWATMALDPAVLAADGIEQEPHVTVLFGFDPTTGTTELRGALQGVGTLTFVLGELGRFTGNPEYDVLKFTVKSPELEALNARLAGQLEDRVTPSQFAYDPHLTLAYVKPGASPALDASLFVGRAYTVSSLKYSLPNGVSEAVPLAAYPANQLLAGRAVLRTALHNGYANHLKVGTDQRLTELQAQLAGLAREAAALQGGLGATPDAIGGVFKRADKATTKAFNGIGQDLDGQLTDFAAATHAGASKALAAHHGDRYPGAMSEDTLGQVVGSPVHGTPVGEHLDKLASDLSFRFKAAVRDGLERGEGPDQVAERVEGTHGYAEAPVTAEEAGHEFHGNQWTAYDKSVSGKADIQERKEAIEKAKKLGGGKVAEASVDPSELHHVEGFDIERSTTKKKVASIVERLKSGSQIPKPVVVIKDGKKQILDGNHSVAAWKKAFPGKAIEVHVPNGQAWDVQYKHIHGARKRGTLSIKVPLLDHSKKSVGKLLKSAIAKVAAEAVRQAAPKRRTASDDTELGWQWVAVLDANTCPECEALDGERWDEEYEPVGDAEELERPPLHPNCRCALVPVDLGEPATAMSFDDYLSTMSRKEQEAAFGKRALKQYRTGKIGPAELVGDEQHLLSLDGVKEVLGL